MSLGITMCGAEIVPTPKKKRKQNGRIGFYFIHHWMSDIMHTIDVMMESKSPFLRQQKPHANFHLFTIIALKSIKLETPQPQNPLTCNYSWWRCQFSCCKRDSVWTSLTSSRWRCCFWHRRAANECPLGET